MVEQLHPRLKDALRAHGAAENFLSLYLQP
jgi:hypothetical protein